MIRRNILRMLSLVIPVIALTFSTAQAYETSDFKTVEDYNKILPVNGVGLGSYIPSVYTGFAMRVENPERLHVQVSRGNNARVTAYLDDETILTYLYQLKRRYDVFKDATARNILTPNYQDNFTPYYGVIEANEVLSNVEKAEAGTLSDAQLYDASLRTLTDLNPGRIFHIQIDVSQNFAAWKKQAASAGASVSGKDALILANAILFNRLNLVRLNSDQLTKLNSAVAAAAQNDAQFLPLAHAFFLSVATDVYNFKVGNGSSLVPALNCPSADSCKLDYHEFTAVYPVGSVDSGSDSAIPPRATKGLYQFVGLRGGKRQVDSIPDEGYYAWIPKLFFHSVGNALHNPATGTSMSSYKSKIFGSDYFQGIPGEGTDNDQKKYSRLWMVSRAPVSHGCIRMASGHIWEVRFIFPALNDNMSRVRYYGSNAEEYDVYDIEGDGKPEVMGVSYFFGYRQKDTSDGDRVARDVSASSFNREGYYASLYKTKNAPVLDKTDLSYSVTDPVISVFEQTNDTADSDSRLGSASPYTLSGTYPLYEQDYERDKLQFAKVTQKATEKTKGLFGSSNPKNINIQVFGRLSDCGKYASVYPNCAKAKAEFDTEYSQLSE